MEILDILCVLVGVSLFPLFLDVLNTFIPIGRVASVYTSGVLIVTLLILYATSLYYYFAMIIPFFSTSSDIIEIAEYRRLWKIFSWIECWTHFTEWSLQMQLFTIFGLFIALLLWFNTLFCYSRAILYSPSRKKNKPVAPTEQVATKTPADPTWCRFCNIKKEEGTHHCRQCGVCIENMDHHCPFTSNCVSTGKQGNFHFFFLFIFYTTCGCAFGLINTALPFWYCNVQREVSARCIPVGSMGLIFVVGLVVFFGTAAFTGFHIFLIFFGRTTLEFLNTVTGRKASVAEIDMEHKKVQEFSKLNCTAFQFIFPYFIPTSKLKKE